MMKTRTLTITVLYDDASPADVEVVLDKMQSDWLHSPGIAEWKSELSEPSDSIDRADWDYFWEYDSETDEWRPVN